MRIVDMCAPQIAARGSDTRAARATFGTQSTGTAGSGVS
jgi:hypothetical protein